MNVNKIGHEKMERATPWKALARISKGKDLPAISKMTGTIKRRKDATTKAF